MDHQEEGEEEEKGKKKGDSNKKQTSKKNSQKKKKKIDIKDSLPMRIPCGIIDCFCFDSQIFT